MSVVENFANNELGRIVALLAVSLTFVPLFKRIGLGSVMGYLFAGIVIGPSFLVLFKDPHLVISIAEIGVVMFLFIVGLEINPQFLWSLRKAIFGLGLLQFSTNLTVLTLAGIYLIKLDPKLAFVLAAGFSISSTAIIMQFLQEKGLVNAPKGRRMFAGTLFEDLTIVPILVTIMFLSPNTDLSESNSTIAILSAVFAIIVLLASGKWLMNPLFRMISSTKVRELMPATALFIVLGAAFLMQMSGLSMALGALVAGIMLSESSFRHQIQADIESFRGLLLGLFFMGVGMSLDIKLLFGNLGMLLGMTFVFVFLKTLIVFGISRLVKLPMRECFMRCAVMAHGGEFAFVLFSTAVSVGLFSVTDNALFTTVVILSMIISPILIGIATKLSSKIKFTEKVDLTDISAVEDENLQNSVIVVGFGRLSQIVCQVLLARGIDVTVIETNTKKIRSAAKFGFKVYYGDGTRMDVLRASGLEHAKCVIVAIKNIKYSGPIVEQIKHEYPFLPILAQAYDRQAAVTLAKLEVDYQIRQTLESALSLGRVALMKLGADHIEANEIIDEVRKLDEQRFNEEVQQGFSAEITTKYYMPKPLTPPKMRSEALNEAASNILTDEEEQK